MRRIVLSVVVCLVALVSARPAAAIDPTQTSITCDDTGGHTARLYRTLLGRQPDLGGLGYWVEQQWAGLDLAGAAYWMSRSPEFAARYGHLDDAGFVDALYRNVLGRAADPAGLAYWTAQIPEFGRHRIAVWMTVSAELGARRPLANSAMCGKALLYGLDEVRPGIAVGQRGSTVTVVADRQLVDFKAVDVSPTSAGWIAESTGADVVVNANWFTPAGPEGPVVVDGFRSGSADVVERGQLVSYQPGCDGRPNDGWTVELEHVWMGDLAEPGPCVQSAVSGISLIHQGRRADGFPGISFAGYTHANRSHSFIGFNDAELIVIATEEMTTSQLADYALALGVTEGVMLDGGGSTQIETPTARLTSARTVPTFAMLQARAG
ncbi:MAG: DUF4214 domain-containing protein [Actinomycetota bacterium]